MNMQQNHSSNPSLSEQQLVDQELGFANDDDSPTQYMRRTREWYLALGYNNPYRWAHYVDVPFRRLEKPLERCRVTLITTAAPYQPDKGNQGPGASYNASAKFYEVYSMDSASDPDVRISHVGIDRKHTSMEDSGTWFPLSALRLLCESGRVMEIAPRMHGVPTNRSQRHTLMVDGPECVRRCIDDGVDAAFLIPNCPICHQTLSLVARLLEQAGIATVVLGCAKDIVEHCGVPRLLFSDFPLGNAAGRPHDVQSQNTTMAYACQLLEQAFLPRTTVQSPLRWSESFDWKLDYLNANRLTSDELEAQRRSAEAARVAARAIREDTLGPKD